MFDKNQLKISALSALGAMLLDAIDEAIQNGEFEDIEIANQEIGQEVIDRVSDPAKLEHLMDYHWNKWKGSLKPNSEGQYGGSGDNGESYYELRALMCGFVEMHSSTTSS